MHAEEKLGKNLSMEITSFAATHLWLKILTKPTGHISPRVDRRATFRHPWPLGQAPNGPHNAGLLPHPAQKSDHLCPGTPSSCAAPPQAECRNHQYQHINISNVNWLCCMSSFWTRSWKMQTATLSNLDQ